MITEVRIPKMGIGMTEATLTEWLVDDGCLIAQDAPLYVMESDKSTTEIASPASGRLAIISAAGETYLVGHHIATISS